MIRLGERIRLTSDEVKAFAEITDLAPTNVKTLDGLQRYVDRCKAHCRGHSLSARFLHWLIDREYRRCVTRCHRDSSHESGHIACPERLPR